MRSRLALLNEKLAHEAEARQAVDGFLKKNEARAKEQQERMHLEAENARRELKLAAEQDSAARSELTRLEKELRNLRDEVAVARHEQGVAAASEARANAESDELRRRREFAAKHFGGENTDRGRAYIKYGPPDEIESHPSGKENWRYKDAATAKVKLDLAFQNGKLVGTQAPR
jgi:GWxTD domain-containing protein